MLSERRNDPRTLAHEAGPMALHLHSFESERPADKIPPVSALSMIAAPLALLAAMVIHPPHAADAGSWLAAAEGGPDRFYAAHLLILVAVALFVPATLALADLARPRRPGAATLGSALTLLGVLAVAVLVGMDFVAWQVARSTMEADQALVLLDAAVTSPGVIAPLAVLLPGLVLGPALLVLTLHREGTVPAWRAALIPLGLVGVFGGLPIAQVAIAGAATLVLALSSLGLEALSGGRNPVDVPRLAGLRRPLGYRARYRLQELGILGRVDDDLPRFEQ